MKRLPSLSRELLWRVIESILFVADEPVDVSSLSKALRRPRGEIEDALAHPGADSRDDPAPRSRERLAWIAAVALLTAGGTAAALWNRPVPNPRETRLEIATPPTTDPISLAISPDGRQIVFVATSNGKPHLWIRRLDSTTARPT